MTPIDVLGWLGALLLGGCAVPQAIHSWRTKSSKGITWLFAGMWFVGEVATIFYIFLADIWTIPLVANYAINISCLLVIIYYLAYPNNKGNPPMQNIENVKQSNPKDAIGCTKPGLSVIPWGAMRAAGIKREDFHPAAFYWFAAAMLDGACKYGRHNYRAIGVRASIYYDATNRHSDAILAGELIDPDSGLPHLLKMVSSLSVLVDAMESGKWYDDRPPRQRSHQMFNDDMCAIDMLDCWWEGADMVFLHRALFKMFSAFHDDYCAEHRDSLLHPMAWMTEVQAKVKEILAKYPDPKEPFTEVGMRMREAQLEADRALDVPDVGTLYGQARGGGKSVFGKGIDVPDVDAETVPASQPLTREEFAQAFTAPAGTPWHTPPTDDGITICINCGSAVDYYRGIKTDNHMAVLSCHCGLLKRERPLTEIGAS